MALRTIVKDGDPILKGLPPRYQNLMTALPHSAGMIMQETLCVGKQYGLRGLALPAPPGMSNDAAAFINLLRQDRNRPEE